MSKKISFGLPSQGARPATLDELVKSKADVHQATPEPSFNVTTIETRRVSVDLPLNVHTTLKLHCVRQGITIADHVRALIDAAPMV